MKDQISVFIFILMGTIYFFISIIFVNIPKPIFSIILIFLSLIYFVGFKTIDFEKFSSKRISFFAILISVILFTTPLDFGSDVTNYILGARTAFLGGYNPYVTPYTEFKPDLIYDSFKDYTWAEVPYTYSPLFLYISGFLLFLSGGDLLINMWLFKFLFLLTFIAGVYVFSKLTSSSKLLYLFSLNPIILNELVRIVHIESLLILIIMAGLYFYKTENIFLSFLAFLSLVFIKIYFILFLPLLFINIIKKHKDLIKQMLSACLVGFFIFFILYFPFWRGIDTFSGIIKLVAGSSQVIISINLLSIIIASIVKVLYQDTYRSYMISSYILLGLGLAMIVVLYFMNIRKPKSSFFDYAVSLNTTYLLFLFLMVSWYFPHYATISIMLFSLLSAWNIKKYSMGLFFLTFYSSFYYIFLK